PAVDSVVDLRHDRVVGGDQSLPPVRVRSLIDRLTAVPDPVRDERVTGHPREHLSDPLGRLVGQCHRCFPAPPPLPPHAPQSCCPLSLSLSSFLPQAISLLLQLPACNPR